MRKIKFIVHACRWFDKVNGNTYHSCEVIRCKDSSVLRCPFQYGYGDQYRYTALWAMAAAKWLPVKYRGVNSVLSYERENNYPVEYVVSDGLKREVVALGGG